MTRRALAWVVLVAVVVATLAVVGIPVWLLQPFAPQTPAAVEWSWRLRRAAPLVTLVGGLLSVALALRLWRAPAGSGTPFLAPRARRLSARRRAGARVLLVALMTASAGTAWFARQNHFEWMFRPFPDARFLAAADAHDVPAQEPVIGVADSGEALAFPITRIGYHHLVNTTLGDVPIVATY